MHKLPPSVRRLFRLPVSRDRLLREMNEEIEAHLTMRADELKALGMSDADAHAEAVRRFGDSDEFRDYAVRRADRRAREIGLAQWIEECAQDSRDALRQFRRTPVLSAVVVLTLALCIGATTAVYGVVRHVLLAPLPYSDGNRIVSLEARHSGEGDIRWNIPGDLYRAWTARSRTLTDFSVYTRKRFPISIGGDDRSTHDTATVAVVSTSFLPMLRVRLSLGRVFTTSDAERGATAVALLSDAGWRKHFGGDPPVMGRLITVNGVQRAIVGVLPPNVGSPFGTLQGEEDPEVWLPLNTDSVSTVQGFARLRSGITSAQASKELDAILHTFPDTGRLKGRRGVARSALDLVEPDRQRSIEVLFGAAIALLLLACADIAGLLLMRGWVRRRELAIRQALGAARGRLTRMLLTESTLLALPGGLLGLGVAWLWLRPAALGHFAEVHLDTPALLWTSAASLTTVLLFGVGPAFLGWERSLDGALRAGGSGGRTHQASARTHATLVVGQIALTLVILASAGVLARSFVALLRTPVGYEPHGLLEVSVKRPTTSSQQTQPRLTRAERSAFIRSLYAALAATPGVVEVAAGTLPMTNIAPGPTDVEGAAGVRSSGVPLTAVAVVSPDYFRVARISLVRGRTFDGNSAAAAGEIVVSQSLGRQLWPDRDPLGARLRLGERGDWLTVVGISGDISMPGGRGEDFFGLQMYLPTSGSRAPTGSFLLRMRGDATTMRPLLAAAVERASAGVTLENVGTAESNLEYAYRGPRLALSLFGAFAIIAVALSAIGLFGIVAFAVARRTREIGIRVALGADPSRLTRTILGQSLWLVACGCAIGLVGAYAASRALTTLVYGVSPTDPVALAGAVGFLALVAIAASAIPVRRALLVDPVDTLRAE